MWQMSDFRHIMSHKFNESSTQSYFKRFSKVHAVKLRIQILRKSYVY